MVTNDAGRKLKRWDGCIHQVRSGGFHFSGSWSSMGLRIELVELSGIAAELNETTENVFGGAIQVGGVDV